MTLWWWRSAWTDSDADILNTNGYDSLECEEFIAIIGILLPPRLQLRLQLRLQRAERIQNPNDLLLHWQWRDGNFKCWIDANPLPAVFLGNILNATHRIIYIPKRAIHVWLYTQHFYCGWLNFEIKVYPMESRSKVIKIITGRSADA